MKKNVYVLGVFDLFHVGHLQLLKTAKGLGEKLVVGINSDELVRKYKREPIIPEIERLLILESCKYIDEVFIVRNFDNKRILIEKNIDLIIHGDDWTGSGYLEQIGVTEEFLQVNNIEMKYLPYFIGRSTSGIIKEIIKKG
jgi:glycerol-3-phosphate cytidylyltransferase